MHSDLQLSILRGLPNPRLPPRGERRGTRAECPEMCEAVIAIRETFTTLLTVGHKPDLFV